MDDTENSVVPLQQPEHCTLCNGLGCEACDMTGVRALQHVASADCWCEPEVAHVDPETGATVYVHKRPQ